MKPNVKFYNFFAALLTRTLTIGGVVFAITASMAGTPQSIVSSINTVASLTPPVLIVNSTKRGNNLDAIRTVIKTHLETPDVRTLPLASHWNGGESAPLYSPAYQISLLNGGAYILPWLALHAPGEWFNSAYYSKLIHYICDQKLPITLLSTQWESILSSLNQFTKLPPDQNPNLFDSTGTLQKVLRANSPANAWYSAGQIWANSGNLQLVTKQCSDPTFVLFLSNNEHPKQQWADNVYAAKLATGIKGLADDNRTRKKFGDEWINLYKALIKGFRDGLPDGWKSAAHFAGYNAFSSSSMGRWPGWLAYSLYTPGRYEPWVDVFEGASVDYYLYDWSEITDFNVYSPQIEAMNYLPILSDTLKKHPSFWFEISIWDGYEPGKNGGKRAFYKKVGQIFDECRYQGYVRYGAWLLRPRVLREFRAPIDYSNENYFNVILNIVNEIHTMPDLAEFWLSGELVQNRQAQHPYQSNLPPEITGQARWFLLSADTNQGKLSNLSTVIETYAIALKNPQTSRHLLFVYSPTGSQNGVNVTVPGYGNVAVSADTKGSYYILDGDNVKKLETSERYKACGK